jgi:hypothetical protein
MKLKISFHILISLFLLACAKTEPVPQSRAISFGGPQKVQINGYDGHIMEPFLSRDGSILFFNNSNAPDAITNIHYALRLNDLNYNYQGELSGINTSDLEGVPTMDETGKFYFVSTRSYFSTLSSLYTGDYENGAVTDIELIPGLSKNQMGWLNFDVEVSKDGNHLFFVDGRFDENGGPHEANLVLASKNSSGNFERVKGQNIFQYINTKDLEYAACISADMLELYFTRVVLPITGQSFPQIFVATRESITDPFSQPYKIENITGFVEAATISPDGIKIYFHKLEEDKYQLYMVEKSVSQFHNESE